MPKRLEVQGQALDCEFRRKEEKRGATLFSLKNAFHVSLA